MEPENADYPTPSRAEMLHLVGAHPTVQFYTQLHQAGRMTWEQALTSMVIDLAHNLKLRHGPAPRYVLLGCLVCRQPIKMTCVGEARQAICPQCRHTWNYEEEPYPHIVDEPSGPPP